MEKEIGVLSTHPDAGLTSEQAAQRTPAGARKPVGKSEQEILLTHCFTFFNLIFVVLGAMLLLSGSTVMNMGFLMVALINTVIGIIQEIRFDPFNCMGEMEIDYMRFIPAES